MISSTQVSEVGYEVSTISSVSYSEIGTRVINAYEEQGQFVYQSLLLSFNEYIRDTINVILSQSFNAFEYIKESPSLILSQSYQSQEKIKERFNVVLSQAFPKIEPISEIKSLILSQSYKTTSYIRTYPSMTIFYKYIPRIRAYNLSDVLNIQPYIIFS